MKIAAFLDYYQCNTALKALELAADLRTEEIERIKGRLKSAIKTKLDQDLLDSLSRDLAFFTKLQRELCEASAVLAAVTAAKGFRS